MQMPGMKSNAQYWRNGVVPALVVAIVTTLPSYGDGPGPDSPTEGDINGSVVAAANDAAQFMPSLDSIEEWAKSAVDYCALTEESVLDSGRLATCDNKIVYDCLKRRLKDAFRNGTSLDAMVSQCIRDGTVAGPGSPLRRPEWLKALPTSGLSAAELRAHCKIVGELPPEKDQQRSVPSRACRMSLAVSNVAKQLEFRKKGALVVWARTGSVCYCQL